MNLARWGGGGRQHGVCWLLAVLVCGAAVRAEPPPGVVVAHSAASTGRYIGSPSFLMASGGDYLASHDFFGPGSGEAERGTSEVYGSEDHGQTWCLRSRIEGAFYSVLFEHRGTIYLLGVDRHPGPAPLTIATAAARLFAPPKRIENSIVIRRSLDGGRTWTAPEAAGAGTLRTGEYGFAPSPVVEHGGRLWYALNMGMLSASVDADLLAAASWQITPGPASQKEWFGGAFEGWGEGNAVVTPEGRVANLAKVRYLKPGDDHAALATFDAEGKALDFDPGRDLVRMPGARIKFTVRFDPVSKRYWAVTNYLPPEDYGARTDLRRNTLALVESADLHDWHLAGVLLHDPDTGHHGFQYFDWTFDGDDIIGLSRTAWPDGAGGPNRQHDANYLTFHRFKGFRSLPR